MATEEKNGKRPRRTEAAAKAKLAEVRQYCEIKRDVLKSLDASGKDPLWASSIEAYEDVLRRLGV